MPGANPLSDSAHLRQAVLRLWLANVALGALVGTSFLAHVPLDGAMGPKAWAFAVLALVSTVATLTLVPGLSLTLIARWLRSPRALGALQAFVWTVFLILLYVDTRIYNLFRYHFNGQVWDLIYTRGSEDAVHLGWQVWTTILAGLLGGCALQYAIWSRCVSAAQREVKPGRSTARWMRPEVVWSALLLPAICLEKTIYAQADLSRDRQVTSLARLFPFYPRIPAQDLATLVLGSDEPRMPAIDPPDFKLRYPLRSPIVDPAGPRPNVLVLVIDCWRRDMLSPEVTPELAAFAAQDCRRFESHISGGNSTRFGVFSMIYGLHGSYWFPVYAERRSPVLLDTLQGLGYDARVYSSASADYPELRATAWSGLGEEVHDRWPGAEPWQRDEQAAEGFLDWIRERARVGEERPFFAFVMLDSPHQTYSHPPEQAPFQPSAEGINYVEVSNSGITEPLLLESIYNRYRNAVRHTSRVAGRLLDEVQRLGVLESTLTIVTGDHGEEFREHGYFGHTSNFAPVQVAVPLLMRGPGIQPGIEQSPTSHLDLPATLLELLGADPLARSTWCLGANLLAPETERCRVVAGWRELGLWTGDGILRVPLHDRPNFDVELYGYDWRLVPDDRTALRASEGALARLGSECQQFLASSME